MALCCVVLSGPSVRMMGMRGVNALSESVPVSLCAVATGFARTSTSHVPCALAFVAAWCSAYDTSCLVLVRGLQIR
jgi:hypothetical protein